MNKINLCKQRQSRNGVSILTSLAVLASPLVLPLQQAQASLTTVVNFTGPNGAVPKAGVLLGSSGEIYGTTSQGGSSTYGTIFKLNPVFSTLVNFTGTALPYRGSNSIARLFELNKTFYGVTYAGGTSNVGALFSYATTTGFANLGNFNSVPTGPGAKPAGRLIADSTNTFLWGTASAGGAGNLGTIFKYKLSSGLLTAARSFTGTSGTTPGANPLARLQLVTTGGVDSYYGTASTGGAYGKGVVFRYTPTNPPNTQYTFYSFTGVNGVSPGASPQSGLIVSNGFLYGTTSLGGANNLGVIFKIPVAFNTVPTLVAPFTGINTGANPKAALTPGVPSNIFYGTASTGGAYGKGGVYKVDVNAHIITLTASNSFNTTNGATPESTLIPVTTGTSTVYYGTTSAGGISGKGNVFKFIAP